MIQETTTYSTRSVTSYFDVSFSYLNQLVEKNDTFLITDKNVFQAHKDKFEGWQTIVIDAGEQYKQQATLDFIICELIRLGAQRKSTLVGVGGGVITDLAGFTASIFMRGVKSVFVPTTVLAMVDAAIGGKNGVDVGVYKNMVGTIKQPDILFYDFSFLQTLPQDEWINGFAEIIKHACIKDEQLFGFLENHSLQNFIEDKELLAGLIQKNVTIKTTIVVKDEFETGERKLLNFGHTIGHALENIYELPHGKAISIGMIMASKISEQVNGFNTADTQRLTDLLTRYHLPVKINYDAKKVFEVLTKDKKRAGNQLDFICLNKPGDAVIVPLPLSKIAEMLNILE